VWEKITKKICIIPLPLKKKKNTPLNNLDFEEKKSSGKKKITNVTCHFTK
jgi:hypothetical protein